jgi:hypothetical protein
MNKFLLIIFFSLISVFADSQDETSYFVQFKISQVGSLEEAQNIDKKIGAKKGILSTHTDYKTSTYFCTLGAEIDYTFENFQGWFSKMGYEITCFNKGIQGSNALISPHELKVCIEDIEK